MSFAAFWQSWIEEPFSPFVIIVMGTFLTHEVYWALFNIPYLIIADKGWFQRYKLQPKAERSTSQERWSTFRTLARDHVTQMLPLLLVSYPLFHYFGITVTTSTLPSTRKLVVQFLVFNVIEDTGFYWVHRALHHPRLFKAVHWKHHAHTAPYSLAGEIAHPAEFLFNFLLPLVAGPFVLGLYEGVHIATFWLWTAFREARGADAHSGYDLPFHPLRVLSPIYGGPRMHDTHHTLKGLGSNFGGYKFWDWLMGTTFDDVQRQRAAARQAKAAASS